jgi:hypothetical protein
LYHSPHIIEHFVWWKLWLPFALCMLDPLCCHHYSIDL